MQNCETAPPVTFYLNLLPQKWLMKLRLKMNDCCSSSQFQTPLRTKQCTPSRLSSDILQPECENS